MTDQVFWRKTARIIELLANRLQVSSEMAMDLFYNSRTYELFRNPDTGMRLNSDQYILTDIMRELESKT